MRNVSAFLDGTRWVAALLVAAGHMRNFIMVDWGAAARHDAVTAGFYWLTGFGRIAVIVFFVLSGYLVGGRALLAMQTDRFRVGGYALSRLARLYPPLIAALVITAVLDAIGMRFGNDLAYYEHPNGYGVTGMERAVRDSSAPGTAALNLAFLQTLAAPTFGSNTPLWSLANEFWYYVLGPCLMAIVLAVGAGSAGLLALLPAVVIAGTLSGLEIVTLFATWLAGAAAYRHARPRPTFLFWGLFAAFLLLTALVRSDRTLSANVFVGDLAVAAVFALSLAMVSRPSDREGGSDGLSARLAGFSYSLYLVHVPACFLTAALALQHLSSPVRLQPGPVAYAVFGAGLVLAIALAYATSRVTEARTAEVREWLASLAGAAEARLTAWTARLRGPSR